MESEGADVPRSRIMSRCRALSRYLEDSFARVSVCFCLAALSLALALAARIVAALDKPLWTDELLTVYVVSLGDASTMSHALRIGVDGQPVSWHWLNALISAPSIDPHLSFRLLSILGYGMAMLGAMLFVGKRFGPTFGLVAALLVSVSMLGEYAIEARPYSVVVGLLLIAAALWQRVDERRWMAFALCLTLSLATMFHYLAILAVGCFIGAELAFVLRYAKKRRAVWLSLLVATTPFIVNLPALIRFQQMFAEHFWSKPSWSSIVKAYGEILGLSLANALLFMACAGVVLVAWTCGRDLDSKRTHSGLLVHEITLSIGLLVLPVFLVVVAKITGGGFHFRYVLPSAIGILFLLAHFLQLGASGKRGPWIALSLLLTSGVLHGGVLVRQSIDSTTASVRQPAYYQQWLAEIEAAAIRFDIDPQLPIVVAKSHDYLPATYYLDAASAKRLYHLTDRALSIRYTNTDSGDRMMVALGQALPHLGGVQEARAFIQENRKFLVWSESYERAWVNRYLVDSGMHIQKIYDDGQRTVYVADAR